MSRFEFRWKSLLALRQSALDTCRAELGAALAEERSLIVERAALASQLNSERRHLPAEPGWIDLGYAQAACRFESIIRSQMAELDRRRQLLEAEIERRRQAALEADRQLRTLDQLRTRQLAQFAVHSAREERKHLSEVLAHRASLNVAE